MKRFLLLVGLVATVGLTAASAPQAAVVIHDYNIPITTFVTNPCNGDFVPLTGTLDLMLRLTTSGSGRLNLGEHINFDLSGVGAPSGAEYNVGEVVNIEENNITFDNGATEITEAAHLNVISKGSEPNFLVHVIVHETITPDGDITSFKVDVSTECRG